VHSVYVFNESTLYSSLSFSLKLWVGQIIAVVNVSNPFRMGSVSGNRCQHHIQNLSGLPPNTWRISRCGEPTPDRLAHKFERHFCGTRFTPLSYSSYWNTPPSYGT